MSQVAGSNLTSSFIESWRRFHEHRPLYIVPITVLTGVYLAFELSFNARLLDVVGGLPTQTEVKSIEHWGRYISGIALALAIWGTWIMPMGTKNGWSVLRWGMVLLGSAAIAIYAVYTLEGDLIDYLTDNSNGLTRQRALYLGALRAGIVAGDIQVPTMKLTSDDIATPEGKTFSALFPVLAYSDNDLIDKADRALSQLAGSGIDTKLGNPAQAYARYRKTVTFIGVNMFNKIYAPALDRLHDRIALIPQQQAEAWNTYVSRLPSGLAPATVPSTMFDGVRIQVQQTGVPVPSNWQPSDQTGFYNAVDTQARATAHAAFEGELRPINAQMKSNDMIPEELTWEAFFALPLIQGRVRSELQLPDTINIPPRADGKTFDRLIYAPLRDAATQRAMHCYRLPSQAFENGAGHQDLGARFMRLLLVPPIALAFSLIGALVHITKFSNYSLRLIFNRSWLNIRTIGCVVAIIGLSAFLAPNSVTTSEGFLTMRTETRQTLGPFFVYAFTWVIQAQHYAYPFDEGVRTNILRGVTFGYSPAGRTGAASRLDDPCAS